MTFIYLPCDWLRRNILMHETNMHIGRDTKILYLVYVMLGSGVLLYLLLTQ